MPQIVPNFLTKIETDTDFKYFINFALRDQISWEILGKFMDDFTSTLSKSKQLNRVLLEQLQEFHDQLKNNEFPENVTTDLDIETTNENDQGLQDIDESSKTNLDSDSGEFVEFEDVEDENYENEVDYDFSSNEIDLEDIESKEPTETNIKSENKCKLCQKVYKFSNGLEKHMKSHEIEAELKKNWIPTERRKVDKKFECDICGKKFEDSRAVVLHKLIHSDERAFSCDACDKSFKTPGNLRGHELIHKGEKTIKCELCGKKCQTKAFFEKHKKAHEMKDKIDKYLADRKLFDCTICFLEFGIGAEMKPHRHTYREVKNCYTCKLCEKSFSAFDGLKFHDVKHRKQIECNDSKKPFRCDECPSKFGSYTKRSMHKKAIHCN